MLPRALTRRSSGAVARLRARRHASTAVAPVEGETQKMTMVAAINDALRRGRR
jgi:hypothetical protein